MRTKERKTKRERFKTVAPRRVQRVLDDLDLVWRCSGRNTYEYTPEEAQAIVTAIRDKVDMLEKGFERVEKPQKEEFSLPK